MKLVFDFAENEISKRITDKILQGGANVVAALQEKKYLRELPKAITYPFYCYLSLDHIDDYARITGTTVGYFFFNEDQPTPLGYTLWDKEIIKYLDALTDEQLQKVRHLIHQVFPCKFPYQYEGYNCHQRISALLKTIPGTGLAEKNIVLDPSKKWNLDVRDELSRLRQSYYKYNSFRYRNEYLADLSLFAGVSLHWILDSKTPLFCKSAAGDELFDHITFLGHEQQRTIWCILKALANEHDGGL